MNESMQALIIGLSALVAMFLLIWPKGGILGLFKRITRDKKRELIEDSLKYIYNCEYNKNCLCVDELKNNLSISSDKVKNLLHSLEETDLIKTENSKYSLTSEGRSYALRIIRIHRLLERHFADQTSYKDTEWHDKAENAEHSVSFEEANRLAAKMGNPIFDPHGDPIPNEKGQIPLIEGKSLKDISAGIIVKIIHIEDEPTNIYSQLVALGISPGMQITITEKSDKRIKFIANNDECVIAPAFAENITVAELNETEQDYTGFSLLADLKPGYLATVRSISKACRGQQRRRLLDFGIVPGTKIYSDLESLGGDPAAYIVRGTKVALRKKQAREIYISDIEKEDLNG
ncbi:MAG: hypothetical protein GXX85_06575 [Ignavibacteria bacterium]|nr:hypothetical protein [Ignavibacteria bacterium]